MTVTAFDGEDSSPPGTAEVTIGNTAPSLGGVSITPAVAYTDSSLTATAAGWSDPDGDLPLYQYEWFADGSAVGTDSDLLDSSEFVKDEEITVLVTPLDAVSSGVPALSPGVTILNTLPTAPVVSITPAAPTDVDPLLCAAGSSFDADGDSVSYSFGWTDGAVTQSGATLAAASTAAGDTWTCTAIPNDGDVDGPAGSASVPVTSSTCGSAASPNTCSPSCASPSSCLNNWSTLSCAPPVVTSAYFTNCSTIGFGGATWCFVVEGDNFQLDYTTQGGAMKWGSARSGVSGFGGSNWNWLLDDMLVVTVGSWYSSYVGETFWIDNPDGQESGCVVITYQ